MIVSVLFYNGQPTGSQSSCYRFNKVLLLLLQLVSFLLTITLMIKQFDSKQTKKLRIKI